jgi:hypothetical protein
MAKTAVCRMSRIWRLLNDAGRTHTILPTADSTAMGGGHKRGVIGNARRSMVAACGRLMASGNVRGSAGSAGRMSR